MIKTIVKYILTFLITMLILIALLFLSSLIPSKYLQENIKASSEILIGEGERIVIDAPLGKASLFYFTDALMINTAYSIDSNHPYKSMMLDRKNYIPGQTLNEHEEIEKHVGTSPNYVDKNENTFQVAELYGLMHDDKIVDSYEYSRYWHGYLIFLRPLLAIMDLGGIRLLLLLLTVVLCISLLFLIIKKLNLVTAIIYIVSFVMLNIFIICNSMNEITTFLITLIAMMVILLKNGKFKNPATVFLCIGICTSFFDLLTTPLVTLGFTLPLYVLQNLKDNNKKLYIDCIKICVAWAVGYGLCWALKWIITDITLNKHILKDAINQILYRTGDSQAIDYAKVIILNINQMGSKAIIVTIILLAIYAIIGLVRELYLEKSKFVKPTKIEFLKVLIFIIIAIFPFAWYFLIKNHSYIHCFFTNRILFMTILNIQIALTLYMGLQDNLLKKELPEKADSKISTEKNEV